MFLLNLNNPSDLAKTLKLLESGEVIILQTDTIFGFACDGTNLDSLNRIYEIKKRELEKNFLFLIESINIAKEHFLLNDEQETFLCSVWPGPVSCILNKKNHSFPPNTKKSCGLRVPNNLYLQKLLAHLKFISTTSCNISGEKEINDIKMLEIKFSKVINYLAFYNLEEMNKPSQIFDLTYVPYRKLR